MSAVLVACVVGLSAGIAAFKMAWTEQHRKLASVGILLCGFGLLQRAVPILLRGIL